MSIFSELDPRTWLWRAVGAAVVVALLGGAWHSYKVKITKQAVEVALVKERAVEAPKLIAAKKELEVKDNELNTLKRDLTVQSEKYKQDVARKSKELTYALTQNKQLKTDLSALRSSDNEFQRVLSSIETVNLGSNGASASSRLIKLGAAYKQCESEYREERNEHSETIVRLDEALSVVKALRIK